MRSRNNLQEIGSILKIKPTNLLKILLPVVPEIWSCCLKCYILRIHAEYILEKEI